MRKLYLLLCILIISFLCGCQSGKTDNDEVFKIPDVSDFTEPDSDIDFGDTAYNFETDAQNYFNYNARDITAGPDGYYTMEMLTGIGSPIIKIGYIDRTTKKYMPLCSRTDCSHDRDSDCDAYTLYSLSFLNYYDGDLYNVRDEFDESTGISTTILHRISADGSIKEDVFELYNENVAIEDMFWSSCIPNYVMHRGYIYYTFSHGNGSYLYKKELGTSASPQLICKNEGDYAAIGWIKGYGNGIVFGAQYGTVDGYASNLLYYDEDTDEVSLIMDNIHGEYDVAGDYIIYRNTEGTGMMKYSLKEHISEMFTEGYTGQPSYDGNYIYIDNQWDCKEEDLSDRKINVYDLDGNLIDTVDMAGEEYFPEFGDEYYLFKISSKDDNTYMLDKSQIGTGSHEWIKLE